MEKAVIFNVSGECPDIGAFREGEERSLDASLAEMFIGRGICRAAQAKKTKEDKNNGRD